jgi:murein DD-endopeptidase MepM/ murein hydrolase activator NlpD
MMNNEPKARSRNATSAPQMAWARRLAPAAPGICAAVLLGGSGFGLGCLYVRMTSPETPPAAARAGPDVTTPRAVASARLMASGNGRRWSRPVMDGKVSSDYGKRPDPFTGLPAEHRGIDIAGPDNSAILAVAPGVVTRSGSQPGFGNFIEIDHGGGWVTRYGHNAFNLVMPGDYVKPGQTIALMGATGRATGTHLHFEVLYRGSHQDPVRFARRGTLPAA